MSQALNGANKVKTIWKFPLRLTGEQQVEMPYGATILCVQQQGDTPCLWAKVDPNNVKQKRVILICGTGNPIDEMPSNYIGTVQAGSFVWHVFEAFA